MNKSYINSSDRYIAGLRHISITDDFGKYMRVGDTVEVHVMPFDYKVRGELIFDEEECSFFVKCDYGKHSLSHFDEYRDMGACIPVNKSFKYIDKVVGGDC